MAKGKYEYWLTDDGLLLLAAWARDGLTDEQIAHNMGIAYSTLRVWKEKYSALSAALKKNKEIADAQVENALFKRAIGCKVTEVIEQRLDDKGQNKRHNGINELTESEWEFAIQFFGAKCCYCGTDTNTPTKDHIIPLNKGGLLTRENILPCCGSCNSSKKDHDMMKWYKTKSFFSKERLEKINEYLSLVKRLNEWFQKTNTELAVVKKVTTELPPDVKACVMWLKNRKPDVWRDKVDPTDDETNAPIINITVSAATPADAENDDE